MSRFKRYSYLREFLCSYSMGLLHGVIIALLIGVWYGS